MKLLQQAGRWLAAELQLAFAATRDGRLALLLGIFAALMVLAAQAPLHYGVDVGVEDGPGSDLPLVAGFHPRERDLQGTFRWTTGTSHIRLPGVGVRPLQLTLRFIAVSPEVAERGPRELELWANGALAARLPVRPQGAVFRVLLSAPRSGDVLVELRSATLVPTGDERAIGAGLAAFGAAAPGGPALPAARPTLLWLLAALLAWLAVRRAGFAPAATLALLLPLAGLAGLAALLDPPRFAFGAVPAATALALGWALALLLGGARPYIARQARRLGVAVPDSHWRWLALMAVAVLAARYGGKIYPDSMPGDIGFHINRMMDVARGTVLLVSRNRGVDFPYPPAPYLLLMPWLLAGVSPRVALQLGGALLDALSPLLVYAIAARYTPHEDTKPRRRAGFPAPLVAAAIYSFSAAGMMVTWWNFSTHIFAQFAHLLLVAALVVGWPLLADRRSQATGHRPQARADRLSIVRGLSTVVIDPWFVVLVVLQSLVYLGHFGFWMNMSLLGAFGLVALLGRRTRGSPVTMLLGAFVTAQALAVLLFYSGYAGLLLSQAQATAAGGLTGLAGRAPVSRAALWAILWDYGLRTHFGFFPLPLALVGGLLLRTTEHGPQTAKHTTQRGGGPSSVAGRPRSDSKRAAVLVLMAGTLLIALFFAALPFLSGSTLSSRWLMFSAWAVAVGAAAGAERLWRRGVAGRVLLAAAGGYVAWAAASMWLTAMIWRVRPPEPF